MEGDRSAQMETLVALVADLTPRRRYDIGQRLRFLAASSEGWCEPVYLALADIVAEQPQADDEHGETMGRLGETEHSQ